MNVLFLVRILQPIKEEIIDKISKRVYNNIRTKQRRKTRWFGSERRQYYEDIKILSNKRIYSGGGY